MGTPDEWLDTVRKCEYLPEQDIKKLCEMVGLRSACHQGKQVLILKNRLKSY
jgi:hypothetical protein